jgi:hypothetical protein
VFSGEEDPFFDNASHPPQIVITAILKTRDGKKSFDDLEPSQQVNTANLFKGLKVHLSSKAQQDMIVRGEGPMSGADNTWFGSSRQ